MKYYYEEHLSGYDKVKTQGKTAWAEIHGGDGFENFSSRSFLVFALPRLRFSTPHPRVLEIGCGTGPGACFLAQRGFQVDGIDIIPLAIEMAREQARLRNLTINYRVHDICELPQDGEQYDMIVDSFCLQCIVTDADRARAFAAVRSRLKLAGTYLISSAMFDPPRLREKCIVDSQTGITYHQYGQDGIIDSQSGIALQRLRQVPADCDGVSKIGTEWFRLNRRHLKPSALRDELECNGFRVLYQDAEHGGHLICERDTD
jgi:SAM-dependent methyltransferase